MKKGQVLEGIVERVDFPNKGIVRVGEDTVVVKNSLPGQKVKLGINKVRKGKAEGRLLEVLEKSPLECGRTCSHFGLCGGCTYLSLEYEEQLHIKEQQVKHLLDQALAFQAEEWTWEGIKGSPKVYEYRNKMEFSFGDSYKDGPLALGMHKRGSFYDVENVDDCIIVDADYRLILQTVREYFAQREVSFFHRLRHEGYLRHLLVRKASRTGEILVALVTTSQNPWKVSVATDAEQNEVNASDEPVKCEDRENVENIYETEVNGEKKTEVTQEQKESVKDLIDGFLAKLLELEHSGKLEGCFAGILHIFNDSMADVVQSDHTDILYGQDFFYEELLGLKFKISTFSFFQTNSYSAEVLYQTAREYVGNLDESGSENVQAAGQTADAGMHQSKTDKVVFDLYSGTGTIAQLMAPVADKVIGVEIVEEAVEAARRNARDNGLNNCEFIAGDVLKVLDEVEDKPDMIILDPPRDGIHPKALPKIIAYGVDRIVYISCKPTSLARDLEVFLENGYHVKKAVAVDQFPWTANVETIVLLSHKSPDSHINVKIEFGEGDGKVPLEA